MMHNLPAFPGADEHDVFKAGSTNWKLVTPTWAIMELEHLRKTWTALTGPIVEVTIYVREGHFFADTDDWLDESEWCLFRMYSCDGLMEMVHVMRGTREMGS